MEGDSTGTCDHQTHLPEQHSQQQEDEDSHKQTYGNDPSHNIATGLQVVQGFKDYLEDSTRVET
jgi:hypothetical protein